MKLFTTWRARARQLRAEVMALVLAARDPRTPLIAKIVAVSVIAYALSPLDLIPDFVPVLGYVDDLLLVPLGIILARRLIPVQVIDDCRAQAAETLAEHSTAGRVAAAVIVALWLLAGAGVIFAVRSLVR